MFSSTVCRLLEPTGLLLSMEYFLTTDNNQCITHTSQKTTPLDTMLVCVSISVRGLCTAEISCGPGATYMVQQWCKAILNKYIL